MCVLDIKHFSFFSISSLLVSSEGCHCCKRVFQFGSSLPTMSPAVALLHAQLLLLTAWLQPLFYIFFLMIKLHAVLYFLMDYKCCCPVSPQKFPVCCKKCSTFSISVPKCNINCNSSIAMRNHQVSDYKVL